MLTEEERRYLAEEDAGGWADERELRLAELLIAYGRAEWRRVGAVTADEGNECEYDLLVTLPMGEKALRIDALIRQWGFGS